MILSRLNMLSVLIFYTLFIDRNCTACSDICIYESESVKRIKKRVLWVVPLCFMGSSTLLEQVRKFLGGELS